MIGLKRGAVKLVSYDTRWVDEFEKEKQRLFQKIGHLVVDIQHIGSTSVPGLVAKPIIDMSAGVRRFKDASKLTRALRALGYTFDRKFQHQLFFAKGPDAKRTHYLHVMRYRGVKWNRDMLFRNYLRLHQARARAYEDLKIKLAERYPSERQKYSNGKNIFIKKTIRLASKEIDKRKHRI